MVISHTDHQKLSELLQKLRQTGNQEHVFVKVEMIFYEVLNMASSYGTDVNNNNLLLPLKQLKQNEYQDTKGFFRKSSQRERAIQRFIHRLKSLLTIMLKEQKLHINNNK